MKYLIILFLLFASPAFPAITFDADDDYATAVGYTGVTGTTARSFLIWFKSGGTISTTDELIGWGDTSGSGAGQGFRFSLESGILWLRANNSVTGQWGSGLADDAWHSFIYTFPAASTNQDAVVYIDGAASAGTFGLGTTALNTDAEADVGIAVNATSSTSNWDGEINEVAIWNAVLTATEASLLHNAKVKRMPLQIQKSALQAYWALDDLAEGGNLASANLIDMSSNARHMTGNDAGASGGQGLAEPFLSYP